MSTTGIGSGVPGFDVLFPGGEPWLNANGGSSSASSSSNASSGLNPYQQQLASLTQWQYQTLQESLFGNEASAQNALYASAGLSADQFANLASELQNIQASGTTGSIVNTTA